MSKVIKASIRLDQALVQVGLVPSRTKAKELIVGGQVEVLCNSIPRIIVDPAFEVAELSSFEAKILSNELLKYVSRAGLKLEGAIKHLEIESLDPLICMDAGQSTGGFTQVLLHYGAKKVVGFDVGHDQLHGEVKLHSKVEAFEGVNAKAATQHEALARYKGEIDFIVGDISFISFRLYVEELSRFLKIGGHLLFLIKPQFELDRSRLNKKGVVKYEDDYMKIKSETSAKLVDLNYEVLDYFESCITGQDGNREFFVYAKKN